MRRAAAPSFAGRHALVTGASSGIGAYVARFLAEHRASVTVTARRRKELDEVARTINGTSVVCDLTDRTELETLAEVAAETDILVLNAALPGSGTLDSFSVAELDHVLDTNLRAPLVLARAALPNMTKRGNGSIIFMSSISAKYPTAAQTLYGATKAGLRAAAHAIRQDMYGTGVTVSVLFPGPVSEVGMWAETGLKPPKGMKEVPPTAICAAITDAITHDVVERDLFTGMLRVQAVLAQLRPAWSMALSRFTAKSQAAEMTVAHGAKR
ncbi:SDR family oxidoreductase [Amycolatopsis sp. GM8]|uniref:SDR family NAD(P)-dependent oxidoreductase n=1 Tax=Amycolatopsis sp. GM8 TaxID=2896530 RepID=UPI001F2C3D44|nr:SDR family oxidoreductase [Amycolatopsis sp. GM8]